MGSAAVWTVLVAAMFFFLWCTRHAGHATVKAILVRLAHIASISAGVIGASGLIGQVTGWIVDIMTGPLADKTGEVTAGTSVVFSVVYAVLGFLWVLGMLPKRVFSWDPPDWLALLGLILPALWLTVPGPIGEFLRDLAGIVGEMGSPAAGSGIGE